MAEGKVCPRCGAKYSYIERRIKGNQVYLYAVHRWKENGKTKIRKCYLGPERDYIYVTKLHEDENLVLMGLMNHDRAVQYLKTLVEYFSEKSREELTRQEIEALKELVDTVNRVLSS
ncbi:MAG: hypothetical protein DRJ38_09355 [Thermoprotei archaeon]|nr:MAG: hypothetical protein DRJ38_09340 [Thermoprotei archaeon]RLE62618.1 MAG: hypothetical protein DRJ38_09355 [Thermoprotei archaeon]